jgi:hypothetical protein
MPDIAPVVNLNAPCPCGSGRKYKRCCYAARKTELARARAAREQAANLVLRFSEQRSPGRLLECRDALLAPLRERYGQVQVEERLGRFNDLFIVDLVDSYIADEPLDGERSPIEVFLADPAAADLHPAARSHLEAWASASLSLYEVVEVTPGESLLLKDLLDDRLVRVADRTASQGLELSNVVVTRVLEEAGETHLASGIYYIPRQAVSWFRRGLEEDRAQPELDGLTWAQHLRRRWRIVPTLWLELLVGHPDLGEGHECHDPECDHEHHHP